MQPRIPRQSAGEPDVRRPDHADDDRLSPRLAAVVSGARRRALRDGDRQIDTAHLLHSLLENDPEVCAVLGDGPRMARLLGYLVQRSIGYGLRWQGTVEDSGAVPTVTEAAGFSPSAATAIDRACGRAARRGDGRAGGVDLLVALVAEPGARAVEVLGRAGVDPAELLGRAEAAAGPAAAC